MVDVLSKHGKIRPESDYDALLDVLRESEEDEVADDLKKLIDNALKQRVEADRATTATQINNQRHPQRPGNRSKQLPTTHM